MAVAKYAKQPGERKRYKIDYTDWLDTGENVTGTVFTVQTVTAPPLVIDDVAVTPDAKMVQYYISGGVDGVTYHVDAQLTTNTGPQRREDEIIVAVREI